MTAVNHCDIILSKCNNINNSNIKTHHIKLPAATVLFGRLKLIYKKCKNSLSVSAQFRCVQTDNRFKIVRKYSNNITTNLTNCFVGKAYWKSKSFKNKWVNHSGPQTSFWLQSVSLPMHHLNVEIQNRPHKDISDENWKQCKGQSFSESSGDPWKLQCEDPPRGYPAPSPPLHSALKPLVTHCLWRRGSPKSTDDNVTFSPQFGFRTASPELLAPTLSTVQKNKTCGNLLMLIKMKATHSLQRFHISQQACWSNFSVVLLYKVWVTPHMFINIYRQT